jgi:hypothetical protein
VEQTVQLGHQQKILTRQILLTLPEQREDLVWLQTAVWPSERSWRTRSATWAQNIRRRSGAREMLRLGTDARPTWTRVCGALLRCWSLLWQER